MYDEYTCTHEITHVGGFILNFHLQVLLFSDHMTNCKFPDSKAYPTPKLDGSFRGKSPSKMDDD